MDKDAFHDQKMNANIFALYDKWHGVVMEPSDNKIDIVQQKILCDLAVDHIEVKDDSRLTGNGKFYGEEFAFNGECYFFFIS